MSQSVTNSQIVQQPKGTSKSTTATKPNVTSIKSQFVPESEFVPKSPDATKSRTGRKLSPDKKLPIVAYNAAKPKVTSIKSQFVPESESVTKSQDTTKSRTGRKLSTDKKLLANTTTKLNVTSIKSQFVPEPESVSKSEDLTKSQIVRKLSPDRKLNTVANTVTKPKVTTPRPSRFKPNVFAKSRITEVLAGQSQEVPKPFTATKPRTANKPHSVDHYNAPRDTKRIEDKLVMNLKSEFMAESITMAAKARGAYKSPMARRRSPAMLSAEKKKTGTFDDILEDGVL